MPLLPPWLLRCGMGRHALLHRTPRLPERCRRPGAEAEIRCPAIAVSAALAWPGGDGLPMLPAGAACPVIRHRLAVLWSAGRRCYQWKKREEWPHDRHGDATLRARTHVCAYCAEIPSEAEGMRAPLKAMRAVSWKKAREAQEAIYRAWVETNAADLAKLPRKARAELKREKWASLAPPAPPKPQAPRSAGQEARKAKWHAARDEIMAELRERLRR